MANMICSTHQIVGIMQYQEIKWAKYAYAFLLLALIAIMTAFMVLVRKDIKLTQEARKLGLDVCQTGRYTGIYRFGDDVDIETIYLKK